MRLKHSICHFIHWSPPILMHIFLRWLAQLTTPCSGTNMFCPLTFSDPFYKPAYTYFIYTFTFPLHWILKHSFFVIYVIKDKRLHTGPLMGIGRLGQNTDFYNDSCKAKTEVQLSKRNMQSISSFPWSGGNLMSGGVCSVFAWGVKRVAELKLRENGKDKVREFEQQTTVTNSLLYPVL